MRWVLLMCVGLLASFPVRAQVVAPSVQACMGVGNGAKLSSKGCNCSSSADCLGTCSATNVCIGGPDLPVCSKIGNQLDLSAAGCACTSNNDCAGVCRADSMTCAGGLGGGFDPPVPACPLPGSGGDTGANGCPCNTNNDCVGVCNANTRTCGAVVGAVANIPTAIAGVASNDVVLGGPISDQASVSGGRAMPARVTFTVHPPGDTACSTSLNMSSTALAGMGLAVSPGFVPTARGLYRYTARYAGNAWNLPAATACGDVLQQVEVTALFANGFE